MKGFSYNFFVVIIIAIGVIIIINVCAGLDLVVTCQPVMCCKSKDGGLGIAIEGAGYWLVGAAGLSLIHIHPDET